MWNGKSVNPRRKRRKRNKTMKKPRHSELDSESAKYKRLVTKLKKRVIPNVFRNLYSIFSTAPEINSGWQAVLFDGTAISFQHDFDSESARYKITRHKVEKPRHSELENICSRLDSESTFYIEYRPWNKFSGDWRFWFDGTGNFCSAWQTNAR